MPKDILGVWRLVSLTSESGRVMTGQSHLVVKDEVLYEVWPPWEMYEGAPSPDRPYELTWVGDEGRLEIKGRDGGLSSWMMVKRLGHELQARLSPRHGQPAGAFDGPGLLAVYQRETDPTVAATLSAPPRRKVRGRRLHAALGQLLHDDRLGAWTGRATWDGSEVELFVRGSLELDEEAFDRTADRLVSVSNAELRTYAAAELLDVHNDDWSDDGDPPLDAATIAARLRPQSLTVAEEGTVTVFFSDGGLFSGHSVVVVVAPDGVPVDAQIAG
ncbi:MAG: DUF2262 domain-containing protein [Myxococcales bacterium]|nr:DUF2262 domain-containing protein [Myxococcales bacterium]